MAQIPSDVIGRAAADPEFRSALLADPVVANARYFLGLTDDQLDAIRELDPEMIDVLFASGGGGSG